MSSTSLRIAVLDVVPGLLVDCAFYLDVFALQFLVRGAGGSNLEVSLVYGVYTLAYGLLAPLLGRTTDRGDRRRVLRVAALLFAAIPGGLALLLEVGSGPGGLAVSTRLGLPVGPIGLIWAASLAFALSNALFWPALQARIGDRESDLAARGRAIRRFNVGWTVGKALGPLLAGLVFVRAPAACLPLGAAMAAALLLVLLLDPPGAGRAAVSASPEAPRPESVPQARRRAFLLAGLAANFAVWASMGALQLAPTMAEALSIPADRVGTLLSLALAAQGAGFLALGGSRAWAYRPATLVAAAPAAALGLLLVLAARGFALAAVGAVVLGLAQAVSYAASVFYSLDYDHRRGLRTGIHEATLALAGGVSILGGLLADVTAQPRAPLLVSLVPCAAIALVVAALLLGAGARGEART